MLLTSVLFAMGCRVAEADRIAPPAPMPIGPRTALAIAPAKVRAPYDVQVLRENGETLPTFAHKDRFYVQGNAGERYVIRITNPTANRIEAVVSVDGLDVVDGESGDLRKRGYIVPPYGETRIEGFRTSQADVATFRFSSVDGSYAGKKGKARNVGVIAVALFEEEAAQQIIAPDPGFRPPYDYEDDLDASAPRPADKVDRGGVARASRPAKDGVSAQKKMAPPPPPATGAGGAYGSVASRSPAPTSAPRVRSLDDASEGEMAPVQPRQEAPTTNRPGLGTEFGEQRYSSVSFTKFVRAAGRPIAIAELRYNDTSGLVALGIPVSPLPDEAELMTRETADPFPGDGRFATPPRR
jgi:hypothetical protein